MMSEADRKTHLFSLRVWAEPVENNKQEWRGKLQALPQGEAHYFRGWADLLQRLKTVLDAGDYTDNLSFDEETGAQK